MTVKCEQCQFEQVSNGDKCEKCHADLNHKEKYVICTSCGLSNDRLAKTCVGCNAKLKHTDMTDYEKEIPLKKDLDSKSLFFHKAYAFIKQRSKKQLMVAGGFCLGLCLSIVLLFMIFSNDLYIHPEEGFYYLSGNNELYIVDEDNDKTLLLSGVETVKSVKKFKKNIYFLADDKLYHYDKKKSVMLAEGVHSYKVNLDGKKVLYSVFVEARGYGDLYLYDGKEHLRIDGHVGDERFIFDADGKSVFYVKDITPEENLGTLYYKEKDAAPRKVADDVYSPLLSLKTEKVYFTRKDIHVMPKYEVYYANGKQIIEIDRHVKHIMAHPDQDQLYYIQEKNKILTLYSTKDGQVSLVQEDIDSFGQYTYGDISEPLVYLEPYFFLYSQADQATRYVDLKAIKNLEHTMENYHLSQDQKVIYTYDKGNVDVFDFDKGKLKNKYNIASKSTLLTISPEGKYGLVQKHTGEMILSDRGKERSQPENSYNFKFSDNEKYLMYRLGEDTFVHTITAKEPVYLSETAHEFFSIDRYVYYFEGQKLMRYKFGKFKSKKEIDSYKTWSYLE